MVCTEFGWVGKHTNNSETKERHTNTKADRTQEKCGKIAKSWAKVESVASYFSVFFWVGFSYYWLGYGLLRYYVRCFFFMLFYVTKFGTNIL